MSKFRVVSPSVTKNSLCTAYSSYKSIC